MSHRLSMTLKIIYYRLNQHPKKLNFNILQKVKKKSKMNFNRIMSNRNKFKAIKLQKVLKDLNFKIF